MSDQTTREWDAGHISDETALRALCFDLGEVLSDKAGIEAQEKALRSTIERIVQRFDGQKAEVAGFGALSITASGESTSYDSKACDALVAKLAANGYAEIAEELAQARKTTRRSASLRIVREKAR